MATEKQKLFVYFGRVPTNVCYNGVSFPIAPGDIIKCYAQFIAAFIKEDVYKEVATGKPRHIFPRSPFFMTPDPEAGLPMKSTSVPNSHRLPEADQAPPSPALWDDNILDDNPYDMTIKDGKTEVSTFENVSSSTPVPADAPVPAPEASPGAGVGSTVITEDNLDGPEDSSFSLDLTDSGETVVEDEPVIDIPGDQGPKNWPGRTELRKKTADEIRAIGVGVLEAGSPLKPELLETFAGFTPETPRGPVFDALWTYYGYDTPEE